MLLGDVMTVFLGVAAFVIVIPALWLLCRGLWPERVDRASARCGKNLYKPLLVGIPVTLAAAILAGTFRRVPGAGGLLAGSLFCLYLVFASVGVSGLAATIGARLSPGSEARPFQATLRGSAILALTYLIPVLGWFLILPASLLIGVGATTLSFFDVDQRAAGASLAAAPSYASARNLPASSEYRGFATGR